MEPVTCSTSVLTEVGVASSRGCSSTRESPTAVASAVTPRGRDAPAPGRLHSVDQPEPGSLRAHPSTTQRHRNRIHLVVPVAIFGGIAALLTADLLGDLHAGHRPLPFLLETAASLLALVGVGLFLRHSWVVQRAADDLQRDLRESEADARRWREEARQALDEFGAAIGREFEKWRLTEAERSVALMLLEGLSHKEIASRRGTSRGTVRQQALAVYRKTGLSGRSNLAAYFLERLSRRRSGRRTTRAPAPSAPVS